MQKAGFRHLLLLFGNQNAPFSFYAVSFLQSHVHTAYGIVCYFTLSQAFFFISLHLQKRFPWICNISFNGLNYLFIYLTVPLLLDIDKTVVFFFIYSYFLSLDFQSSVDRQSRIKRFKVLSTVFRTFSKLSYQWKLPPSISENPPVALGQCLPAVLALSYQLSVHS